MTALVAFIRGDLKIIIIFRQIIDTIYAAKVAFHDGHSPMQAVLPVLRSVAAAVDLPAIPFLLLSSVAYEA